MYFISPNWSEKGTFDKKVQEHIIIKKLECSLPNYPELTLIVRLTFKVLYVYSYGLSYVPLNVYVEFLTSSISEGNYIWA